MYPLFNPRPFRSSFVCLSACRVATQRPYCKTCVNTVLHFICVCLSSIIRINIRGVDTGALNERIFGTTVVDSVRGVCYISWFEGTLLITLLPHVRSWPGYECTNSERHMEAYCLCCVLSVACACCIQTVIVMCCLLFFHCPGRLPLLKRIKLKHTC